MFVPGDRLRRSQRRFGERLADARREGQHIWVAIAYYSLSEETARGVAAQDPSMQPTLDTENLSGIALACFRCEEPLHPDIVGRPCPGDA